MVRQSNRVIPKWARTSTFQSVLAHFCSALTNRRTPRFSQLAERPPAVTVCHVEHNATELRLKILNSPKMRPAFRNTYLNLARSLNPNPIALFTLFPLHAFLKASLSQPPTVLVSRFGGETFRSISPRLCSSSMAGSDTHGPSSSPSLEKQFEDFRVQLEESGGLRERIRAVVMEIESTTRLMYASLLLVHQSRPTPGNTTISPVQYSIFFS